MKNFLSRYRLSYPRALVFMLQSTEYNVKEYLHWYHRTKDFSKIERRKTLDKTLKARLLLFSAWIILFIFYIDGISSLFSDTIILGWMVLILDIILSVYLLPYLLIIPLFILKLLQKPIEKNIVAKAKEKLAIHKGFKIAIAGSYGKTTMREILHSVLSSQKKVAKATHNYNTLLALSRFIKTLKGDEDIILFEFGEYMPDDIKKMCDLVKPDMAIITGVNEAHLKNFKTIENTVREIFTLVDYVENKPVYINEENVLAKLNSNSKENRILYSQKGAGNIITRDSFTDISGTTFTLIHGKEDMPVFSKLLGLHQIGPIATASDIALKFNIPIEEIKRGIENIKPFSHRLEASEWKNNVTVIDDSYNGNPDGVKAVIKFLGSLEESRKFYVTPGLVEMGDKTEEIHENIGIQLSEANIDKVVLIKNFVTLFIEQGLKKSNYKGEIIWFNDMPEVLKSLPNITIDGDIVLIQNDWPDQYQ